MTSCAFLLLGTQPSCHPNVKSVRPTFTSGPGRCLCLCLESMHKALLWPRLCPGFNNCILSRAHVAFPALLDVPVHLSRIRFPGRTQNTPLFRHRGPVLRPYLFRIDTKGTFWKTVPVPDTSGHPLPGPRGGLWDRARQMCPLCLELPCMALWRGIIWQNANAHRSCPTGSASLRGLQGAVRSGLLHARKAL